MKADMGLFKSRDRGHPGTRTPQSPAHQHSSQLLISGVLLQPQHGALGGCQHWEGKEELLEASLTMGPATQHLTHRQGLMRDFRALPSLSSRMAARFFSHLLGHQLLTTLLQDLECPGGTRAQWLL